MKILLVDNYDSFTYNLMYLLEKYGAIVEVKRNDQIEINSLRHYHGIVLSPGPGLPEEAGDLMKIIEASKSAVPLLGICLGHQAIAESYGGQLTNLKRVAHGVTSNICKVGDSDPILKDIEDGAEVGRYHSWVVDRSTFPAELLITSSDADDLIMSFTHEYLPIYGLQFHPESILTPTGGQMMANFIEICKNVN